MAKEAKECATHAVAIGKTSIARHDIHGVTAFFEHDLGRLQPQPFDGLGGRLAGFLAKDAAELTRAKACRLGQFLDRQRIAEMLLGMDQGAPKVSNVVL